MLPPRGGGGQATPRRRSRGVARHLVPVAWALGTVAGVAATAVAQLPATAPAARVVLRGTVQDGDARPLAEANVFLFETLDGVLTDSAGRFAIVTDAPFPLTLVVRRIGYRPAQHLLPSPPPAPLVVVLERGATSLAPIAVQAGAYTADEGRSATLTPLQVVTTPGAAADITRAIQTLPGVQVGDEGNALFVRGGDYTETKVFVNDAPLLNTQQLATPSGTFIGSVDPFQLDGIFFSSGGFGARYGNALSGVAGLRTRGSAERPAGSASAGLAVVSADAALPIADAWTLRLAANRTDLRPLFALNGATRAFAPPPRGRDLSASLTWRRGVTGEVKLFSIDQTNRLGLGIDDPTYAGTFATDDRTRLTVLTWRDVLGRWAPRLSLSRTSQATTQSLGVLALDGVMAQEMLFAQVERPVGSALALRTGGEVERTAATLDGAVPGDGGLAPGAPRVTFALRQRAVRVGPFAEGDWRVGARGRVIAGVRADRSALTRHWTVDPRLSVAWRQGGATLTAAWGLYSQVASPLQYDRAVGDPTLPSMRAEQRVAGVQMGEGDVQLRVEAYDKRYRDLVQQRRDNVAVGGGTGSARGVDLFVKGRLPFGLRSRSTLSLLRARRTDPNTGLQAPAPFDITTSATTIVERDVRGVRMAAAWRRATGRPYTPIVGTVPEPGTGRLRPRYGAPYSERLPDFRRLDLSASWYRPLSPAWRSVLFVSVNNLLDRRNLHGYTWSPDYRERRPVRSIYNRSVYFGATLLRQ